MSDLRLCLIVSAEIFLLLSLFNGTSAVECYWCSGVGKDRQCELSPRNVSTGPVSTKCSMRYCISTKVMDGVTGEVQSFARHCDHIPRGNVCVRDSRLITCFETCTSDLCNSGNPDPSYLRTQEYSFTYLGLPGLGSALYRSQDKNVFKKSDLKSKPKQNTDTELKSSKKFNMESLKIVPYKNNEDGNIGNGGNEQGDNKSTRPWKWWEMTKGNRRRKVDAGTVTRDQNKQSFDERLVHHVAARPTSRVESKLVVNSGNSVNSSIKATYDKDKNTGFDDKGDKVENLQSNHKEDKHQHSHRSRGDDSRHTFDYIGYSPLSKKSQSNLNKDKKTNITYKEFVKTLNTVRGTIDAQKHIQTVRDREAESVGSNLEIQINNKNFPATRLSQKKNTFKSFPIRHTTKQVGLEQDNIQSVLVNIPSGQGNIPSVKGNRPSVKGNIQLAKDDIPSAKDKILSAKGELISQNNGRDINKQLQYINDISGNNHVTKSQKRLNENDEQLQQDLITLKSSNPEYTDLTEEELELLPLLEALIYDEGLETSVKTLLTETETVKGTHGLLQNTFPTVRPTYGLLETANIYSSQRDFLGSSRTRSPQQQVNVDLMNEERVGQHGIVAEFRKFSQQSENDVVPQPFRIKSLDSLEAMLKIKTPLNFDNTNFNTTGGSLRDVSSISSSSLNVTKIDQNKPDNSLPQFYLNQENKKDSMYNTKGETPYTMNEVASKVISPGTDPTQPKKDLPEMNLSRSPSDSGSSLSSGHTNLKTRPPHWVNDVGGKRVQIHTGKTKEPRMPLELNSLKFAKPGLRTTAFNIPNAVHTSQMPLHQKTLSSFEKIKVENRKVSSRNAITDVSIPPLGSYQSSKERLEDRRSKENQTYYVNTGLRQTSEFPSRTDTVDLRNSYKLEVHGKKEYFPKNLEFIISDNESGTAMTQTDIVPRQITFDARLSKRYLNNNDLLTSINLKLGKPKFDFVSQPSLKIGQQQFVTPRSDTYKTTLVMANGEGSDKATNNKEIREEKSGQVFNNAGDGTGRLHSDSVSRSLTYSVSMSPAEEVQIATPNPNFSVTNSKILLKAESPDSHTSISQPSQVKIKDVETYASSRDRVSTVDYKLVNNVKDDRKHSSNSAVFRTSGVDKYQTFKALLSVTPTSRSAPDAMDFATETSGKIKITSGVPTLHSMNAKNKDFTKMGFPEMVSAGQRETVPQNTWGTASVQSSNTFDASFNSLVADPKISIQSLHASVGPNRRDFPLRSTMTTESPVVRHGSRQTHTPLEADKTPPINPEDQFVMEAYRDTLKELSQTSEFADNLALMLPLSDTPKRVPPTTVFVTPSVHRLGRLEKLEGARRMFSLNRENVSSSIHNKNVTFCIMSIVAMVLIAFI